jgi:hypothetical protein
MPRGRGGARQGTPGKAYTNRTDLGVNYNMGDGSPATGGMKAPSGSEPVRLPVYPEDIPDLSLPTQRPDEPIADGLPVGPGRGPEAMSNFDPRVGETRQLKMWMPLLEPLANDPETPDSVRTLIQYIRSI